MRERRRRSGESSAKRQRMREIFGRYFCEEVICERVKASEAKQKPPSSASNTTISVGLLFLLWVVLSARGWCSGTHMDRWRTDSGLIRPANRRGAENFEWNVDKGLKVKRK